MWFDPKEFRKKQPDYPATIAAIATPQNVKKETHKSAAIVATVATPTILKIEEKQLLIEWLDRIGETNPEAIARLIQRCQRDISVREYFLGMAEKSKPK